MPFIAIFGLNEFSVRIVAAVLGSVSLPIFYLLCKRICSSPLFSLIAVLTLAVNPWHISISRWALESNILPFFLLLGLYFLICTAENPRLIVASAAVFGVSLYCYGTAFIFLPLFILPACVYLLKKRMIRAVYFSAACIVFLLIAFPITLCNAINVLDLPPIRFLGITLPRLTETRQSATTIFGSGLSAVVENLRILVRILLTQSDGLPWNSISQPIGRLYAIPALIAMITGIASYIVELNRRRTAEQELLVFLAFIAAIISSLFIDININRINMLYIPMIYFQARGLYTIIRIAGSTLIVYFSTVLAALGVLYSVYYFTDYQTELSNSFHEGLGAAILYAESLSTGDIRITTTINAPYLYVLFYKQIPPRQFIDSVSYLNPDGAFRWVKNFDKYHFHDIKHISDKPYSDTVLIIHRYEAAGTIVIADFGNYSVAFP